MTRQEHRLQFIAKWRAYLAGTIALGGDDIRKSLAGQSVTAEALGRGMLGLTPTTDNLLGRLFDDLLPPETEPSSERQERPTASGPAQEKASKPVPNGTPANRTHDRRT